jgi:hypothetical protein
MPRTSTRYVDFRRLANRSEPAALVTHLMIACNDMSLANESLQLWKARSELTQDGRLRGAKLYFVRLQVAHLFEAMNRGKSCALPGPAELDRSM